jgi:hypothetical protein
MKKYRAIVFAPDYQGSGHTLVATREVSTTKQDRVLSIMMREFKIERHQIDTIVLVSNGSETPAPIHIWNYV